MSAKPLLVLCVEDDGDNAAIVDVALALDSQMRVEFASNGEQALAVLDAGLRPDIILLDVRLPGMNGIEVAREIVLRYPDLSRTVMYMTAAVRARQLAEMRATGTNEVIAKPFDPLTLAKRVRAAAQQTFVDDDASDLDATRSLM